MVYSGLKKELGSMLRRKGFLSHMNGWIMNFIMMALVEAGEDEAPMTPPGGGNTPDLGFLQLLIATAHCGNECSN
ncbi:hypothetical protein L1987_26278 [Smallanthus sonchifolius]|uniref:Uncharacterized protein n=1 Tax=Smallanthus sonchifolius TaxID=185202 RepID=A0ACB9I9W6_9ASTR|nr:hypothetical protein L1987_26278 [Smallanthus sonchifolius]